MSSKKSNEIQKVTMKNTKKEIMAVLDQALVKLDEKKENTFDPIKELEVQKEEEVLTSAEESVENNLFSDELNQKYIELNEAIKVSSKRLEEIYEVEKEFQNLVLVVNASKELQEKIQIEREEKETQIKVEFAKFELEIASKKSDLQEDYNVLKDSLELERQREIEKYTYDTKRKREIEDDLWSDEKEERELILSKKEQEAEELLKESEEKIDYIKELEEKVESIPELKEIAMEEGVEKATKDLGREYGYKKAMAEKDANFEKQRLGDRLEFLTKELDKSNSEKENLQLKLEEAYTQLSTLATKTVESTGGVKILNSSNNDTKK